MTLSWISRVNCSSSSRPTTTAEARASPASVTRCGEHRLVDDEFADEIDQAVDPVEIDADRLRRGFGVDLGIGLAGLWRAPRRHARLFCCARCGSRLRGAIARRRRLIERGLDPSKERGDLILDSAGGVRRGRVTRLRNDIEVAIPGDEFEHFADRRLVLLGLQLDRPGKVSALGVEFTEQRQVGRVAGDFRLAEARELAQDQGRFIGLGIEAGLRAEFDGEALLRRRFDRRFDGRFDGRFVEIVEANLDGLEIEVGEIVFFRVSAAIRTEAAQFLRQCKIAGGVDRGAVARRAHEVRQRIGCAQHDLQNVRSGRDAAGANVIERRLEHMREAHKVFETERAGAALDRMHRPKHRVHGLGIAIAAFNCKKTRFQFRELLFAFLKEGLLDRRHRVQGLSP